MVYTQAANQERLAREAIEMLSDWEKAPPVKQEDRLAKAAMKALAKRGKA